MLAAIIALALIVSGCNVARRAEPPTITGQIPTWQGPTTPKVLTARIGGNTAFWEVRDVFVRYARHAWPATLIQARHGEAVQDANDASLWRFTLPAPEDFDDGFAVFFSGLSNMLCRTATTSRPIATQCAASAWPAAPAVRRAIC
jgi:hypothetical protein